MPYDYLFTFLNIKNNCKKEKSLISTPLNKMLCNGGKPNKEYNNIVFQQSIFSYPYLILHIEELDGIYNASSDVVTKSFCKIVKRQFARAEVYFPCAWCTECAQTACTPCARSNRLPPYLVCGAAFTYSNATKIQQKRALARSARAPFATLWPMSK